MESTGGGGTITNREQYQKITSAAHRVVERLPGGAAVLSLPTGVCAGVYLLMLGWLVWNRDARFLRAAGVPAAIFLLVTGLRRLVNRQRPYDRFGVPPVGRFTPNKGRSMPSRHAASAAAIALAVMWVFPKPAVWAAMGALCLLIGLLRIFTGKHYPSDVLAALAFSALVSAIGYSF